MRIIVIIIMGKESYGHKWRNWANTKFMASWEMISQVFLLLCYCRLI